MFLTDNILNAKPFLYVMDGMRHTKLELNTEQAITFYTKYDQNYLSEKSPRVDFISQKRCKRILGLSQAVKH